MYILNKKDSINIDNNQLHVIIYNIFKQILVYVDIDLYELISSIIEY